MNFPFIDEMGLDAGHGVLPFKLKLLIHLITKPTLPQKQLEKVWSLLMLWYLLFLQGLT